MATQVSISAPVISCEGNIVSELAEIIGGLPKAGEMSRSISAAGVQASVLSMRSACVHYDEQMRSPVTTRVSVLSRFWPAILETLSSRAATYPGRLQSFEISALSAAMYVWQNRPFPLEDVSYQAFLETVGVGYQLDLFVGWLSGNEDIAALSRSSPGAAASFLLPVVFEHSASLSGSGASSILALFDSGTFPSGVSSCLDNPCFNEMSYRALVDGVLTRISTGAFSLQAICAFSAIFRFAHARQWRLGPLALAGLDRYLDSLSDWYHLTALSLVPDIASSDRFHERLSEVRPQHVDFTIETRSPLLALARALPFQSPDRWLDMVVKGLEYCSMSPFPAHVGALAEAISADAARVGPYCGRDASLAFISSPDLRLRQAGLVLSKYSAPSASLRR